MTCSCQCPSFAAAYVVGRRYFESESIFGTWDFKWPKGKVIKVAFQELPKPNPKDMGPDPYEGVSFGDCVAQVESLAKLWQSSSGLRFDFLGPTLPPPDPAASGGRSQRVQQRYVDYDVLVSLARMPIPVSMTLRVAPEEGNDRLWEEQLYTGKLLFPTSQLGRFALRADYGVPTVYLGQPHRESNADPQGLLDAVGRADDQSARRVLAGLLAPPGQTVAAYFESEEFKSTIVHEFGHVVGLPHVHQSPLQRPRWRSISEIIDLVKLGTGVKVDEDFVRAQILNPWPSTRGPKGEVLFSDWNNPVFDDDGNPQLDSVMCHPLWQYLLVDDTAGGGLPTRRRAPAPQISRPTEPLQLDIEILAKMYA